MSETILEYGAPPVNEVVVGVRFDPIASLAIPHFGLFWDEVRSAFPRTEHAAPLATEAGFVPLDASTGAPMPRVWFVSGSGNEVIQLQTNMFVYNWRQADDGGEYPRFVYILAQFRRLYDQWKAFVRRELDVDVHVTTAELGYINAIPIGQGWKSWGELGELFPDFRWGKQPRYLPSPSQSVFQLVFPMPATGDRLIVRMNPAKFKKDNTEIVRLELTARHDFDGEDDLLVEDWLRMAREWIVRGFADVTSEAVQRSIWLREEPDA